MTKHNGKEILDSTDLSEIERLVRPLIGQKCWKASISVGNELRLHFGERIPYSIRGMGSKRKGSWVFGTSGTTWALRPIAKRAEGRSVTPKERNAKRLENGVAQIQGAELRKLDFVGPKSTQLVFSNGFVLDVFPTRVEAEDSLPFWELFMPGHMFLAFGPGEKWSYMPSDVPEER